MRSDETCSRACGSTSTCQRTSLSSSGDRASLKTRLAPPASREPTPTRDTLISGGGCLAAQRARTARHLLLRQVGPLRGAEQRAARGGVGGDRRDRRRSRLVLRDRAVAAARPARSAGGRRRDAPRAASPSRAARRRPARLLARRGGRAGRRLTLVAEMKLPGSAILELAVEPREGGSAVLLQAHFHPAGAPGLLYWYALWPDPPPHLRGPPARDRAARGAGSRKHVAGLRASRTGARPSWGALRGIPACGEAAPTPPSRTSVRCAPLRPTHPPSDFLSVGASPPRPRPDRGNAGPRRRPRRIGRRSASSEDSGPLSWGRGRG